MGGYTIQSITESTDLIEINTAAGDSKPGSSWGLGVRWSELHFRKLVNHLGLVSSLSCAPLTTKLYVSLRNLLLLGPQVKRVTIYLKALLG